METVAPGMSDTRNIRLLVQFDGTNFYGFQEQKTHRTVQSELKKGLKSLCNEEVVIHTSSRTDAGVHAIAMPVNFHCHSRIPLKAFVLGMNSILPEDVKVLQADEVPLDFHARFRAIEKTYMFLIRCGYVELPLFRNRVWHVKRPLDVAKMDQASKYLVGTHDFTSFRAHFCDAFSPVRTITNIQVTSEHDAIIKIEVSANGFLRNMVRIIVGTLVQVGLGKWSPEYVQEILLRKDRRIAGPTAPPSGLYLKDVRYPEDLVVFDRWPEGILPLQESPLLL
jgi:tRNA pseudouridine38-40 synthase